MSRILVGGLDLETTGLKWDEHRIIEFGLVIYELETGKELAVVEKRINPQRTIQPAAQAIHGIDINDLLHCPIWEAVAPSINQLLSMCHVLVAHNGRGFDIPFLDSELNRVGLKRPAQLILDTMADGRWATCDGKIPTLQQLAFACGYEYDKEKAHSAIYDVRLMMDCLFYARKKYNLFQIRGIDAEAKSVAT